MAASALPMTLIYLLWARPVNVKAWQMTCQRGSFPSGSRAGSV